MTSTATRPERNGVDVPTLFATLDAVKGAPQIAEFQFRASNEWISGTHNRTAIQGFYGAGEEDTSRTEPFTRLCWSAETTGRLPWSSFCTPSPRA
jgi:hypothetical protein